MGIDEHRKSRIECNSCTDVDVLVLGAGPTGLVAAAEALRHGLTVRVIERKTNRGVFSKALVVHARTLEVFATMGIAEEVRPVGAPFTALNTEFADGRRGVRVDLLDLPWGDTAYPYWLSVPQCDTEQVLEMHLEKLGGTVEWSTGLKGFMDDGDTVEAPLENAGGTETVRARWVIGCDGGRSTVRDQAGITLPRTGTGTTFFLADTKTASDLVEDEGYLYLSRLGLLLIVPMPEPGRWRLIAHVPSRLSETAGEIPIIDASAQDDIILQRTGIEFGSHDVSWTSQFDLTHGVADRFRAGRVFLAGDAAHIHSPVGGQGLNTGVQDAHNLMWKIAQARHLPESRAEELLDTYDAERRGTAGLMVRGVARMTAMMTSRRWLIRRIMGWLAPRLIARPSVQARLGRGVGMLNLSYTGKSRPVYASTGGLQPGSRMPNPELRRGERLFEQISTTGYFWVVQGDRDMPAPDPSAERWRGIPMIFFRREDLRVLTGYPRGAKIVLVRPDLYIAAVGTDPDVIAKTMLPTTSLAEDWVRTDRVGAL